MPETENGILEQAIEEILKRKFDSLLNWKKPNLGETIGPKNTEIFERFDERRQFLINECRVFLRELSRPDLQAVYSQTGKDKGEKASAWVEFLRDDILSLGRKTPKPMAGGFGHPALLADFAYWRQMEKYRLHEALMLSVGVEPKLIPDAEIYAAAKSAERKKLSPTFDFLVKRQELFVRKFPSGGYGFLSVSPYFLLTWFEEVEMDVHSQFVDILNKRVSATHLAPKSAVKSEAPSRTDQREVDKIAQLFAALAIDQLGFDRVAKRSPVPKEITDLAASMGLSISDDTVRKYLKRGTSFIADDWKPK